jgi:hypothetical protein
MAEQKGTYVMARACVCGHSVFSQSNAMTGIAWCTKCGAVYNTMGVLDPIVVWKEEE